MSGIREVCVYSDRALITRGSTINGGEGEQSIVFEMLTPKLMKDSIRVRGAGDLLLMDNSLAEKYLEDTNIEELNRLLNENRELNLKTGLLSKKIEILDNIAASLNGLSYDDEAAQYDEKSEKTSVDDYQKFIDIYSSLINDIVNEKQLLEIERRKIKKVQDRIQFSLDRLTESSGSMTYSCLVNFRLNRPGDGEIMLSYVAADASWSPLYDGRLLYEERIFELLTFAVIVQNTGEEWTGVTLTLSTARPAMGARLPEPEPWYLSIYVPPKPMVLSAASSVERAGYKRMSKNDMGPEVEMPEALIDFAPEAEAEAEEVSSKETPEITGDQYSSSAVNSSGFNAVFTCGAKQDIPTGGIPKKVLVSINRFPVEYEYIIMAAEQEAAYLKIKMKNSLEYPILEGPVKVFRDHDYTGPSAVKNIAPGEDFELFMGIDDRIKVRRELVNRFSEKKGITGRDVGTEYTYKLTIESFKKDRETLTIYEQVPVSQNREIEVKVQKPGGFENPDEKGILKMKLEIAPKEKKEILYSFMIRHPEGALLDGL